VLILHGRARSAYVSHAQVILGINAAGMHADSSRNCPEDKCEGAADGNDSEKYLHEDRLGQSLPGAISPPGPSRPC